MKKLIALLLAAMLVLAMTACGTVNKTEVAVLWRGEGVTKTPNSMNNAMERAMYMKNIAYQHYGAGDNVQTQLEQARQALDTGCAALAVELTDPANAETLVRMAQEKNVPIVFFNTPGLEGAVQYDRGGVVSCDETSANQVLATMVNERVEEDLEKLDRNGDGKISCLTLAQQELSLHEKVEQTLVQTLALTSDGELVSNDGTNVELVVTDSDQNALEVLRKLQALDFNTTRLTTHCIPIYTVGAQADAREFADTADLTAEELAVMIYTAENLVSAGQLAGVAIENYDTMAVATATLLCNWFRGKAAMNGIGKLAEGITVTEQSVIVPYIPHQG